VDAEPHVFFAQASANVEVIDTLWDEAVAVNTPDSGNAMRYDLFEDQYLFNWDVSKVQNGSYHIWVDLDEGACGSPHRATVAIEKKGKRK
jgi:hypothetical protein